MAADGIGAPTDPSRWRDAREWFQKHRPAVADGAPQTHRDAQARAFRVAGITSVNLVTEVHQAIDDAIANGNTLDDFKKRVGAKLAEEWGAPNARRVETIFRTNVQSAYNAGRWAEMNRPAVLAVRPFWKYVAILDGRTTATCAPLNGVIAKHDDAFWESHFPPLHFNCRSTVVSLSRGETERAGGVRPVPKAAAPGKGFGTRPDLAGDGLEYSQFADRRTAESANRRVPRKPDARSHQPGAPDRHETPTMSKGTAAGQQVATVIAQVGIDDAYVRNARIAQWLASNPVIVDPVSDGLVDVIDINGNVVAQEIGTVDPWHLPVRIRLSRWIGSYDEIPAETRSEPSSYKGHARGAFVDSWATSEREVVERIATHEFAHALEAILVHRGGQAWSLSLQSERNYHMAMQETRPDRGPVSAFARKNAQEYFAESVTAFLHAPEVLRARDPDQYSTIEYILRQEGIIL